MIRGHKEHLLLEILYNIIQYYTIPADASASRIQNVFHIWFVHYAAVNNVCVSVR